MIKMTIYRADIHSDYPVPVTAQIDLRYPLAGYVHIGRRFWTTIDLETGLGYGKPAATLKECGPIVADRYDKVQEIKKNPKNRAVWMEPRFRAVREMINKDNNIDLYNHLEKYTEVYK